MRTVLGRCGVLVACASIAINAFAAEAAIDERAARLEDFDRFCRFVADNYAYFDLKKTDWSAVCKSSREQAGDAIDRNAFIGVVERDVDELYDPHAHLGTSTRTSHRLVPTNADLHAVWRDGRATIVDVRSGSGALASGLHADMEVIEVDGKPIADVASLIEPKHLSDPDVAARNWALDVALAGRQDGQPVRVVTIDHGHRADYTFNPDHVHLDAPLTARCIGNVADIRFNNSIGDNATIKAFDDALASLSCRAGLVLDLRDTPSGGTSTVARGVISRLVSSERPYQRHERVSEFREAGVRQVWVEYVEPRGPLFIGSVVVLVGHWTGSMGEGLAIGLNAARGAPVLGQPMAGLLGALDETTLTHSNIVVRVPAERLWHVDGTPREAFRPCPVDRNVRGDGDAELDYAVSLAERLARRTKSPLRPASPHAGSCRSLARR
jgi:carboxyl-terminal processing protease